MIRRESGVEDLDVSLQNKGAWLDDFRICAFCVAESVFLSKTTIMVRTILRGYELKQSKVHTII
jgi:hypothetical protein